MELHSVLKLLNIHQIPQEWVDAVWDLEFTKATPLDETTETQLTASGHKALRSLYKHLLDYAERPPQLPGNQSVWAVLGENRVSVKNLVAVLSFFVLAVKNQTANLQQRVNGLYSASVYLLLLGLPGSIANQVFHEVLMDTCADMANHCWPCDSGKKRKKDVLKSSHAEGKRAKHQHKDMEQVEEHEDEEDEGEMFFSGQDLMKLRNSVVVLVQSLLRLLQTFPLKDRKQSAISCSQIFTKLLYFEPVTGEPSFHPPQDVTELRSIPEMSFYGLQLLCSPTHGDQNESLRRVFHRLLLVILMMTKGNGGKPSLLVPNHTNLAVRDHALNFVCHLVDAFKEQAPPFLTILLQHICFQMVEKSEFRSHGAQAVGMLASHMSSTDYACFIQWLYKFSRQSKMVHRLFSVDVVMVLLEQTERVPHESQEAELAVFLPHKFLIQDILFARRMDSSPTVQGHALSCLAQCLELPSFNVTQAIHNLFSATETQTVLEQEQTTGVSLSSQKTQKTYGTLPFRTVEISSNDTSGYDAKENLALLLRRAKDSKTNVRKSALQALVSLLKHGVIPVSAENVETLSERCRDPAVSVKKKALQCVGELLAAKAENAVVQRAWLYGVLPAVMDAENTVQDKALEALDTVLLSQVKPYSGRTHLDGSQKLTWDLLSQLNHECRDLSRYFSRAFTIWSKQNKFSQTFLQNLISHTEADHAAGAWLLLSNVVTFSSKLPYDKILDAWDVMISSEEVNVTTCCHILSVLGDSAVHLNEDTKSRLIQDVMSWLKGFRLPLEVISASMATLYQLGCSEDIKHTQAFLNLYCGELVSVSEAYLASIILTENRSQDLNEDLMVKHLHTLGVASLHCPAKVGKRTVLLVESILTTHSDTLAGCQEEELPPSLPVSQFKMNSLSTRIRAHGVITLGKLCLQHEDLVSKYLPVFARELEVGSEVAVRNNVVVVMCDLCVRYTNIVDHYIPNIAACLRDTEAVIREQTLIMLTNLLQEEFVKWKGSLFFRYMVALVDSVPAIASLCEYCLIHLLLKKNPEMFSQHFIECIFYFNSYTKHKVYNKFPQNQRDEVRFSLKGDVHREKRFRIYRFLLEHFTDAQRFNTCNKINQTVLAFFADEELPLDADGTEILSETFKVLSLKEMKLQAISAPAGVAAGEEPEEENMATMAKAVMQVAQKKLVSQVQKKSFIENTVPLIISLKNLLEKRRSPVLKELMAYVQVMMQEYRSEVKEFFAGDEQLAVEVEFALKKAEEEKELQEQMSSCGLMSDGQAPVQGSPLSSRRLLPRIFATPQAPRSDPQPTRRALTDLRAKKPISSKSISLEETVMPKGAVTDRAISTPKGININLTFDEGLSAVFSDHGMSGAGESGALHVNSEQKHASGPRQWKVRSPLCGTKR
ncbi:condensin-2 complex subunit D3 isoform X2 [Gouania willdenowi]|uniref:condensin-2 complex subunit D3 isoform X2 n=1 Tax=Gouania willdenowi TaxID=441366 RepID=UPI001056A548|nr:condensin-2 complex subunit D3 isoform X2 [Gouania willdenowi]